MCTLTAPRQRGDHVQRSATQFDDLEQQHEASTLGMWVFLGTEILFFGGLFTTYVVYRQWYPRRFAQASRELTWSGQAPTRPCSIMQQPDDGAGGPAAQIGTAAS